MASRRYEKIYVVVSRIPRGRVATYGQVARLAGLAGQARMVGYALSALEAGSRIPWHRVVNAGGEISLRRDGGPAGRLQRALLQRERVRFDRRDPISRPSFPGRPPASCVARPPLRLGSPYPPGC